MFVKFKRNLYWKLSRYFGMWVFMVLRTGQSWCSAVICRKLSAFEMQVHLIVVSVFFKTYVKDHGGSSSRMLERRISLVRIEGSCFRFCKHLNKQANNFWTAQSIFFKNLKFSRSAVVSYHLWVSRLLLYCKAVKLEPQFAIIFFFVRNFLFFS